MPYRAPPAITIRSGKAEGFTDNLPTDPVAIALRRRNQAWESWDVYRAALEALVHPPRHHRQIERLEELYHALQGAEHKLTLARMGAKEGTN